MESKIAVYGDSIAFGYGSGNKSWFDMLPSSHKKFKLAFNGARICDVLNLIRDDINHYDTVYIAVGINDLLGLNNVNFAYLLEEYEEIVCLAKQKAKNVIVQAVLPVLECQTSSQSLWLSNSEDTINESIEYFNNKLQNLTTKQNCIFIHAYSKFMELDLPSLYSDEVHLNKLGQQQLLEIYKTCLEGGLIIQGR